MIGFYHIFVLTAVAVVTTHANLDVVVQDYHGQEFLDPKGKYSFEWRIDWNQKTIHCNLTVLTTGWVGLGLSKDGTMKDADLMVAGVTSEGRSYISDFHSDCHRNLTRDSKQDWNLISAFEASGRTILHISRAIDTCDPDDLPITDDLIHLLWAFGETDEFAYHHHHKGSFKIYLLDPVMHSSPLALASPIWKATQLITVPNKTTTYRCTIHRAPVLQRKHHIIEFRAFLENKLAVDHTHHFVLYRCVAPPNVDPQSIFEPLINNVGEECYLNDNPQIPIQLCRTMVFVWALGGGPFILPDYVGYSLGLAPFEYYMLEMHYNNPEKLKGISYEVGVEATYTDKLRRNDGGLFMVGYDLFGGFFMIPPGTQSYNLFGSCGPECTEAMFPAKGVEVFGVHHHTHLAGKNVKLHHFRNGKELPWIMKDNNYDYTFQRLRHLHGTRTLLPGDQLSQVCRYDNTWTNVTTVAGFGFTDEMCLAMIYHTNPTQFYTCGSLVPTEKSLALVGVQNVTWDNESATRLVTKPDNLKGEWLAHVTDDLTDWTQQLRTETQRLMSFTPQIAACPPLSPSTTANTPTRITLPFSATRYRRKRSCPGIQG